MLQKLLIKNVALIDCAEINFTDGLNVLSGETGAGKSVIIESLNFVLGAKADKSLIRSGESECFVKAEFDVSGLELIEQLFNEFDFDAEDILIISRKFTSDGKTSIKINGNNATVNMLKKFTSLLVDVHGQSEHFSLLKSSNQLDLVDSLGGEKIASKKLELKDKYSEYKSIVNSLEELGGDERQRLIKTDVLSYQINEIESANLLEGEEQNLLSQREKLRYQEKISVALNSVKSAVSDEGGISDVLSNVTRILSGITSLGTEYSDIYDRLEGVFSEVDDIASVVGGLVDDMDSFEFNADEIEARLDKIKLLKNKYGNTYEDIMQYLENAKKEKELYDNFAENAKLLVEKKSALEQVIYSLYNDLSGFRRGCAQEFCVNVIAELKELGMPNANFNINFNKFDSIDDCNFNSSNGIDEIEFLFSANKGEPLKSMSQVISGGEMSRFMLAIKAQTAKFNSLSTFIFDEIDAGISGNIAKVVANKFIKIAKHKQLIAISHLPQISAMADNNLLIVKDETADKTVTNVYQLNAEQKVKEIVRLVGGDVGSDSAVLHAKELIEQANEYKKQI